MWNVIRAAPRYRRYPPAPFLLLTEYVLTSGTTDNFSKPFAVSEFSYIMRAGVRTARLDNTHSSHPTLVGLNRNARCKTLPVVLGIYQ